MNRKTALAPVLMIIVLTASSTVPATPLMVEKNLFSQERKPPSAEAPGPATPTAPPVPPKAIQLDGIMIHGPVRKALLRLKGGTGAREKGKKDSPFTTVSEGEKVNDYTVTKIGTRSISLEKGGQTFEVFLYAEGKVLPPLAPTPPSAPMQPPPPPRAQGGGMPADVEPAVHSGVNPAGAMPPDLQTNPPGLQGQRGARRAAMPPPEPAEVDETGEEEPGDVGQ